MTRLKIALLFISIFAWRWARIESPLPTDWQQVDIVRITIPIIEQPEHTDSSTIVRQGIWYVKMPGYKEIIPGDLVALSGTVVPHSSLGKVTRIVMSEATMVIVKPLHERGLSYSERLLIGLCELRTKWVQIFERSLSEPMASLAAGILLGVKARMPDNFYNQLVTTGTLHIVAASGYNVMIVASVLMTLIGIIWRRGVAIWVGIIGIIMYVLLSGASASVIRAGIMGSLTLMGHYLGRPAETKRLLWLSGGVMLIIHPLMLIDIGFQLSFVATAGLLYLMPLTERLPRHQFLREYLYPTLAASLATAPVILYHFGRVAWISPLVNILILPLIPLIMLLSSLVIIAGSIIPALGQVVGWILYVPLWWVVVVIRWFG